MPTMITAISDEPKPKCESCIYYQVLNPNHIVEGISVRNCVWGETPDSCHWKEANHARD